MEGTFAIRELLRSRYPVRSLLLTAGKLDALTDDWPTWTLRCLWPARQTMAGIVGYNVHRGALACAGRLPMTPMEAITGSGRLLAVLEGINDLENLGALFRNAAAFALDGVLLCPRCADPLYRRSVRVSVGQVLHVPWTRVAAWPDALETLRGQGFELVALTPQRSATSLSELVADGSRRALLLGAEGPGAVAGGDGGMRPSGAHPAGARRGFAQRGHRRRLAFYQCAPPPSGPSC